MAGGLVLTYRITVADGMEGANVPLMPESRRSRLALVFVRLAALGFSLNSGLYACLYVGNNIVHVFIAHLSWYPMCLIVCSHHMVFLCCRQGTSTPSASATRTADTTHPSSSTMPSQHQPPTR